MHGLDLINQLVDKQNASAFIDDYKSRFVPGKLDNDTTKREVKDIALKDKNLVYDYNLNVIKDVSYSPVILTESVEDLWPYINRQMLYGHHLGLKGNIKKLFKDNDAKALKLDRQIQDVKERILKKNRCQPQGMYQFFKVRRQDETMIVLSEDEKEELQRFDFPRQPWISVLLNDFIHPDQVDTMCFFVVTSGQEILDYAKELKQKEEFLASHIVNAIGLELAEAFAERIHQHIRSVWECLMILFQEMIC